MLLSKIKFYEFIITRAGSIVGSSLREAAEEVDQLVHLRNRVVASRKKTSAGQDRRYMRITSEGDNRR